MTTLVDYKSKAVIQQQLLGDPLVVSAQDFDPDTIDVSDRHRKEMKRKLYGNTRVKFSTALPSPNEALSTMTNYADEELPQWKSTMKAEFPAKKTLPNLLVSRDAAIANSKTHIYMESPGAPRSLVSSTKQDYVRHECTMAPSRYAARPTAKNGYPLIQCEEMAAPLPRRANKPVFVPKPRLNERKPWNGDESTKVISHISFGNSANDWKSVSQHSLVAHAAQAKPPQSEYESLEKTKSTVLDNPDLVLDRIQSVHQAEFSLSESLDRATLTFDNTISKKALNGTHFTLGNEDKTYATSEYIGSFLNMPHERSQTFKAVNSSRLAIIAEDFEDRRIGNTSQKQDYPPLPPPQPSNILDIKKANSRSSIVLGLEGAGLAEATSLTKGDYRVPVAVNRQLAEERYRLGGVVQEHPTGVPYHNLVGMEGTHGPWESINKSDFINRPGRGDVYKEALSVCRRNQKDYVSSHFSLESSDSNSMDHRVSHTKDAFLNPASIKDPNLLGAGSNRGVSRVNDGFSTTIENTITRYPYNNDTFSTTFSSAFKPPTDFSRRQPFEPSKTNQLTGHLHPQLTAHETPSGLEFKHIRELSTVSRRAYVAPEFMKERV
ncbi:hypothetical protein HDU91_002140 [Kappamyces sp. JEL0680]|nr:hypothetical protein HDU91_002140 [Kappamyces sp. JEL0680]